MTDESIFAAALAIPNPAERAAYLDRACGGDARMRCEVEALLAAHVAANPLDRPPANLAFTGPYNPASDSPGSLAVGDRVGPYKLLERIGEGGMGEVWVADQLEPIKRRVALKLIKPGMDTRGVLARFEAERQALALMDHPNIAKVLDAGTTPDGRPYFVMELVKGTPITEFCDIRKLTPRQRLELFVPVCNAIQHAHQKGIIHRDIKPNNVLVELYDDRAVAKVIDFGVAKAIGQSLTEKTLYTGLGAIVGTPAYMAPEQATFNALDVDTRADVYALGVMLYELLAGSPPHEPERLKKAALDEVLRIVRDEEPPRPSQRLSTSQARATIAATRQSDPAKLSALMRGELDWIVMKALEKDRTRRYETANGFAADVQRYLRGDAVEACPPTLGYRLRKAYHKNRVAVLTTTAFASVLVVGAALSLWQAARASVAEAGEKIQRLQAEKNLKLAEAETNKAIKSEAVALAAQKRAEQEKANSDAALDYLSTGIVSQGGPDAAVDPDIKLRTVLDMLAENLKDGQQPPLVEASIRHAIGKIYVFERFAEARAHFQRAYEIRKKELTDKHPDTIRSMVYLGHPDLWREESIARNETEVHQGEHYAIEAWGLAKEVLGPDDITTLIAMRHVAGYHRFARRYEKAEELSLQFLKDCIRTRGELDTWSITAHIDLAWHYNRLRVFRQAESHAKRAVELRRELHKTDDHYLTCLAIETLANVYQTQGRYADAEQLHRQLIPGFRRHVGGQSPSYLFARTNLAFVLNRQGKHEEAVEEFKQAIDSLRIVSASYRSLRWRFAFNLSGYGDSLNKMGRFADAEPLLRESLQIREADEGLRGIASRTRSILGETLIGLKRYEDAESELLAAYKGELERYPRDDEWRSPEFMQRTLERLVKLYEAWDNPFEAAKWRTEYEKWIVIAPPPHNVKQP